MKLHKILLKATVTSLLVLCCISWNPKVISADEMDSVNTDIITYENDDGTILVNSLEELLDDLIPRVVLREEELPVYKLAEDDIYDDLCEMNLFSEIENHKTQYTNIDSDYTSRHISNIGITIRTTTFKTVQFTIDYSTTKKQEDYVTKKISDILTSLSLDSCTDYQKITKIYKYVMGNMKYAYLPDGKTADMDYCTVYQALKYKKGICQSYTLLLNRLLIESDIDSKFIVGTGNGGSHAWSIIKLGDKWYNADVTWDDSSNTPNTYFLKSNSDFKGHIRSEFYNTKTFNIDYPMSTKSYSTSTTVTNSTTATNNSISYLSVPSSISLKTGKSYTIKNSIANVTFTTSNSKVCTVSKKGKIIGNKKGTATITIKVSKTTIAKLKVIVK